MAQSPTIRTASTSFWLASLNQELAIVAAMTRYGRSNDAAVVARFVSVAAGFILTFEQAGDEADRGSAERFHAAACDFARRPSERGFGALMDAYDVLANEIPDVVL